MKTALDLSKYGINLEEEYEGWFEFKGGGWGPKYETLDALESNMIPCTPQVELDNFDSAIQDKGMTRETAHRYQFSIVGRRIRILARILRDLCKDLGVELNLYIPFQKVFYQGLPHRLVLHVTPTSELWTVEKGAWTPSWNNAVPVVVFDSKEIEHA